MAQSMKKEIRKTFGFAREKFSAKVRLDTKMPGVPIILSKSVCTSRICMRINYICLSVSLSVCMYVFNTMYSCLAFRFSQSSEFEAVCHIMQNASWPS